MKIKKLQDERKTLYVFECPACRRNHAFDQRWSFNENYDIPTFTPSLVTGGPKQTCHSYVTDGKIQYLGDCWHDMKGQTVDLPELEWE